MCAFFELDSNLAEPDFSLTMSQSPVSLETTEDTNNLFGSGDLAEFGPKFKLKTFPRISPHATERPPEHDLSQQMSLLQAQMSMLSQLALTRQAAPAPPQNDSIAAILAFQLGEKLGTIGTNGESTKTSLSSVLQSVDALTKQSTDLKHELEKAKLEFQHMDRGTAQLGNRVDILTASITEYGQTLAGLRTELSHASESRHQDRSEASERIRGLADDLKAAQQRVLELEVANSRMSDELRSLTAAQREERKELGGLAKTQNELSKQVVHARVLCVVFRVAACSSSDS